MMPSPHVFKHIRSTLRKKSALVENIRVGVISQLKLFCSGHSQYNGLASAYHAETN